MTQQYERSTALFGLVLSNVLIINLWNQEIGRFTASNYEIIKIIFEINLRFFNQESVKQLLFVIRDFNERENFDYIKKIITEDVNKIWDEIKKPKQFEHVKPSQFFELSFFKMRNFVYEKDKFVIDAKELATRFTNQEHPEFYFKSVDISKNIPFDGLYMFTEKVWETIKENKELNLPSQKIIVSNFRCAEIKKEVFEDTKSQLLQLRTSLKTQENANLRKDLELVLDKSIREFKNNTDQYDEGIVRETESQLRRDSVLEFIELGNIQKDKIENRCVKLMRDKISDLKGVGSFSEILSSLKELKTDIIKMYVADMESGTFEEEESLAKLREKFKNKIESIIIETITSRLNLLLRNLQNKKIKEIENKLGRIFTELQPNFWQEFLEVYADTFKNYTSEVLDLKNDAEELRNAIDEQIFEGMKTELFLNIRNNVTIKLKGLSGLLIDKFRKEFENTPGGMRRNWKTTEEPKIDEYFGTAKRVCTDILDRCIEITFPGFGDEAEKVLFTKEDIFTIRSRFDEEINQIVERVYNSKYVRSDDCRTKAASSKSPTGSGWSWPTSCTTTSSTGCGTPSSSSCC